MARYQGCGWMGPDDSQVAEPCRELFTGTLDAGRSCRSALECLAGLHCRGSGPTDMGHCDAPSPNGSLCAVSVDALGSFTAQRLDDVHPECSGARERRLCVNPLEAGASCVSSLQCGAGNHCGGDAGCASGSHAQKGESCLTGTCAEGNSCLNGRCASSRKTGEKCRFDAECVGACAKDGGVCAPRCG